MTSRTTIHNTRYGDVTLITFTNASGASVTLSSAGASIARVCVPDRDGRLADVITGCDSVEESVYDGPNAGKIPGRYANRIARGHFTLDGKEYTLAVNNGPNALHGGPEGFAHKIWTVDEVGDNYVRFGLLSPDGDEGYPGELRVEATYTWTDDNRLTLRISATTDAPTVINLTNHAYWNLDGHDAGCVLDHTLHLYASRYLPTDPTLIPTGELCPVEGTPMDFTIAKPLGRDIKADFPALVYGKGYDNCWAVDNYQPGHIILQAELYSPRSGRVLDVYSDSPGVQVYTGNWLAGAPLGKGGHHYNDYDAVAIECQDYPDAPNRPGFPDATLRPGDTYNRSIIFAFSTK